MKLKKLIARIPKDKLLHCLEGIYFYLVAQLFLVPNMSLFVASLAVILVEVIWDKILDKGEFEVLDIVSGVLGATTVYILTVVDTGFSF